MPIWNSANSRHRVGMKYVFAFKYANFADKVYKHTFLYNAVSSP